MFLFKEEDDLIYLFNFGNGSQASIKDRFGVRHVQRNELLNDTVTHKLLQNKLPKLLLLITLSLFTIWYSCMAFVYKQTNSLCSKSRVHQ